MGDSSGACLNMYIYALSEEFRDLGGMRYTRISFNDSYAGSCNLNSRGRDYRGIRSRVLTVEEKHLQPAGL